ncbi:MAG TPA: hypothetical protein VMS37_13055 [Verrucomicrobiae bacterium]|nr:hypothetical protein [Verrucomicrobiae bacterium]
MPFEPAPARLLQGRAGIFHGEYDPALARGLHNQSQERLCFALPEQPAL